MINTNNGVITWTPTSGQANTTNPITTVVTDYSPLAINAQQLKTTNTFSVVVRSAFTVELDSAVLGAEDCLPTNNVIDPGETVTVLFAFKNVGTVNTTNLVITLLQSNGIVGPSGPQSYGVLVAGGPAVTQPFAFAANGACGSNISAVLQMQDGAANLGTVTTSFTLGQIKSDIVLTQNFDLVTVPALPASWTSIAGGGQLNWRTTNSPVDSTPNAACSATATSVGTNELRSPSISLSNITGPVQLSFRNNYSMEANATTGYDGGVLEIKIGTNAFVDITNAGGVFISGGYNRRISSSYQSPIAGRGAWSGTSGGYLTTSVSLPAFVVGQTIQFRWRCATDNGGVSGAGWRIDSIGLTGNGYVCCANSAPVLPGQADRTLVELATLTVTNTATSLGNPANLLTYLLVSPPLGAVISTNGVITWTPDQSQSPGTNIITTVAINSGVPSLRASNSFVVTVQEVNVAPVLPVISDQTVNELTLLTVTNTATNPNIHSVIAGYTLVNPPASMTIDAEGIITWTPAQTQSPSTNTITTVVTNSNPYDPVNPRLTATNAFVVEVIEPVSPPLVLSISLSNGLVAISWGVMPGRSYQLQYKDHLHDTNWVPLPPDFVATGEKAATTELVLGGGVERFYRVVLQP